jgi:hypothetical protein
MLKRRFWRSDNEPLNRADNVLLSMIPSFGGKRTGGKGQAVGTAEALLLLKEFEESGLGWFWSTDAEGRLTYLTESISQSLSTPERALFDTPFADHFIQADKVASARRSLPFLLSKQSPFEKVILRAQNKGDQRCWSVSGYPQFDGTGRFNGYRGSAIDVTEHRKFSKHAAQLAKYDSLTGLPNRLRMTEVLEASLLAAEHQKRPCAVLLSIWTGSSRSTTRWDIRPATRF